MFQEGSIVVDGVDISGIGLHDLREKAAMQMPCRSPTSTTRYYKIQ
jgi:hypothetical protein